MCQRTKMKIEILKSAKGNEQKQNKPAKPPKPRQAHMPRKDKAREKKATLKLSYIPNKTENSPQLL